MSGTISISAKDARQSKYSPIKSAQIIYVDDDNVLGPWDGTIEHPFRYIQDGVDHAQQGDTVYVFHGNYIANDITINKTIDLVGENKSSTFICANLYRRIIEINSDHVNVSGFTLISSSMYFLAGVKIYIDSNYCTITDNVFITNTLISSYANIYLNNASHTTITRNDLGKEHPSALIGIILTGSHYNNINENTIQGMFNVALFNSNRNTIVNNTLSASYTCVVLSSSSDNIVTRNNFIALKYDISLINSHDNEITWNSFKILFDITMRKQRIVYSCDSDNMYDHNYWGRPRVLPKVIVGEVTVFGKIQLPLRVEVDWHPARTPN